MNFRAAIYCRMSLAIMDDPTKVEDQARISRDLAGRLRWEIAEGCGYPGADGVYTDNNRSAWQKNRKRPAWDQMLADVKADRVNAIIIYHGDRLIRQPMDLEVLIDLANGKGVRLAAPTGMRDLDNYDDRKILRVEAAFACGESDNTSRRRKNQYERWRREGRVRPGGRGGRAFGFATDGVTVLPGEADIIRLAAEWVLNGRPTGDIARYLTECGWRTPTGGPFTHGTVRKMLARPRYAGLMPDGKSPAAWQPVLDMETWEAVRAVLDAKAAGFGYTTNARKHLLSGIARCSECGTGLQIRMESRRTHLTGYGCVQPGCRKVQRSMELLDEYVITRVLAKLNDPANPPGRVPEDHTLAHELRRLTARRAAAKAQIRDPSNADHLGDLLDLAKGIDKRLGELRELAAGSASARLLGTHAGLTREAFDHLPLATRRALVAACFTVTVLPASRRGPGFRTEDVRLAPPGH